MFPNQWWYKFDVVETRCYLNMLEFINMSIEVRDNKLSYYKNWGVDHPGQSLIYSDKKHFIKEYCVLNYKVPRRTGATTAALKIAIDNFKDSLFIYPNQSQSLPTQIKLKNFDTKKVIPFMTESTVNNEGISGAKYNDFIILDNASLFKDIKKVLKYLCEKCEDNIIILCIG